MKHVFTCNSSKSTSQVSTLHFDMQRKHTELLACSFQHVNMKQRGSCCSTSEQDWSPCCSFYWMCCITDSQLMKRVSVNTHVFFSQQVGVVISVGAECEEDSVCGQRLSCVLRIQRLKQQQLVCSLQFTQPLICMCLWDEAGAPGENTGRTCRLHTGRPHLNRIQTSNLLAPIVFIHMKNVFIEMTQHKQNI